MRFPVSDLVILFLLGLLLYPSGSCYGDTRKPFDLGVKKEVLFLTAGAGLEIARQYSLDHSSSPNLSRANPGDIPAIDRFTRKYYSTSADSWSYVTIKPDNLLPMLTPVLTMALSRKGSWYYLVTSAVLYAEASLIVNSATDIAKNTFGRYRPYVYNDAVPLERRTSLAGTKSMWSGHAANAFQGAVLGGYMFQKYNPGSRWTKPVWCIGLPCATATAVLRVRAGQHFPTDVVVGAAFGSLCGWFIPWMHIENHTALSMRTEGENTPVITLTRMF
ncbi:phosphatase PAP2 family protein [bacterium]|nr:phosphatase PAP2 family protein [bacterium]